MKDNPLLKLRDFGQSIWLDFLSRGLMNSGELQRLIEEDGISGVTSNPSIFEKAIADSTDYDETIKSLAHQGKSTNEIYQALTVADIQRATDLLRPVYDKQQHGRGGFVSLEVSPHLARDTKGTIAEARRLWQAVDRPNLYIKVPGTPEGLPAIRQLISEGINVNVTLLFGLPRYRKVAEAYLAGIEERLKRGKSVERISSVASFFLSRIDVLVDPMLKEKMKGQDEMAKLARRLHGQVAIASAKTAYEIYKGIYNTERFRQLADQGAQPQWLLWASTSTKNPDYSDIKYVEALIGANTINTLPLKTIEAYRDHGQPELRLIKHAAEAQEMLEQLPRLGINLDAVTQQLEDEGIEKFNNPYDSLMQTLKDEREAALRDTATA